jgi:hypothetical protein
MLYVTGILVEERQESVLFFKNQNCYKIESLEKLWGGLLMRCRVMILLFFCFHKKDQFQ